MATSTAAKPYVVQDSVVAPQAETRSGWVTFAGVVVAGRRRREPVLGARRARQQELPRRDRAAVQHPGDVGMGRDRLERAAADRWHHAARAGPVRAGGRDRARGSQLRLLAVRAPRDAVLRDDRDVRRPLGDLRPRDRIDRVDGTPPNPAAPTLGAAGSTDPSWVMSWPASAHPPRRPPRRGRRSTRASGAVAWPRSRSPKAAVEAQRERTTIASLKTRESTLFRGRCVLAAVPGQPIKPASARAPDHREITRRSTRRSVSPAATRRLLGHRRDRADLEERTRRGRSSHPRGDDRRRPFGGRYQSYGRSSPDRRNGGDPPFPF